MSVPQRPGSATSAEQQLLLHLLRPGSTAGPACDDLVARANWPRLLQIAPKNLYPYLAERIGRAVAGGPARVPPAVWAALATARRGNAAMQLQRHAMLRTVLSALERDGIPALVVKGMALSYLVYPDPGLRPMMDLDVWVPPGELEPAVAALRRVGLRYPDRLTAGMPLEFKHDRQPYRCLEQPGIAILLEVHGCPRSLATLPPAWLESLWSRSTQVSLGGIPARILHHEDCLIHLCLHYGRYHRFRAGPLTLLDIQLVVDHWQDQFDFAALGEQSRRLRIATYMYLTLRLARDVLGARVPDAFFQSLPEPDALREIVPLAVEQMWEADRRLPTALAHVLTPTSVGGRMQRLFDRLVSYYWRDAGDARPRRTALDAIRQAGRRMVHDFTIKGPQYVGRWRRGELRRAELRRRLEVERGGDRLDQLVAAACPGERSQPRG